MGRRLSRGCRAAALGGVLSALALPAASPAQLIQGYDGTNPFACELQQVGLGVNFPQPDADPFCVEFDKRQQNVTHLGVVQFLLNEPARVAAAMDKCFYFQHDHWTGWVVQDEETTETYSWDGRYYFDKSRGAGGVYVENFSFNNQTSDPRLLPGFPEEYKPFFGPGRGGVQLVSGYRADPRCNPRVEPTPPPGPQACRDASGTIGRALAGVAPGMTRAAVEEQLGPAARERRGFMRWCLRDGGKLAAGFGRGRRVALVLTTSPAFDLDGVRVGHGARGAARRLRGERVVVRRRQGPVLGIRRAGRLLLAGVVGSRVRWLAVADGRLTAREIDSYARRSR